MKPVEPVGAAPTATIPFVPLYRLDARHPQARACATCRTRAVALFGVLQERELDAIHGHIAAEELPAGAHLYRLGEQGAHVYTLRQGILRFERSAGAGERRIVRLAGCGDLVGQEALLGRPHADDAIACTPVAYCRIPVDVVQGLGREHPALLQELMQRWQQALEGSHEWVAELSTGSARRRVLQLLVRLCDYAEPGHQIWLPRREEIGNMLNLTIETASRQISQLRREGLLRSMGTRRQAQVDAQALRQALQRGDLCG